MLSNSYSAEYGGLAGVVVTTKRGGNSYRGTGVLRLQLERPERPHLQPEALRASSAAIPTRDTHQHRWGASLGGPIKSGKTFFYANYEGSNDKADLRRRPRARAHGGHAQRRLPRDDASSPRDPLTGQPFPDNVIPASRIEPAGHGTIMDFFYPLPNQRHAGERHTASTSSSCPRPRNRAAGRPALRPRGEREGLDLPARQLPAPRPERDHVRGRQRPHEPADPGPQARHRVASSAGWTKIFSQHRRQRVPRRLQLRQRRRARARSSTPTSRASSGSRTPPSLPADRARLPALQLRRRAPTGRSTSPTRAATSTARIDQNAFSVSRQPHLDHGRPLAEGGRALEPQHRRDGFGTGVNYRRPLPVSAAPSPATRSRTSSSALRRRRPDQVANPRPPRRHAPTTSRSSSRTTGRSTATLTVFLGLRYEIVGVWHEKDDLLWRTSSSRTAAGLRGRAERADRRPAAASG